MTGWQADRLDTGRRRQTDRQTEKDRERQTASV